MWNVAAWGWTCQGETRHGLTTVSTWTRDEQVLVLVFLGECDVQAAVLDGESLALDDIAERITDSERAEDWLGLFDRARQHAERRDDRVGTELAALFEAAEIATRSPNIAVPLRLGSRLHNLALAVLSTPGA